MIKRQISPRHLFYYATIVYVAFLIGATVMFAIIVRTDQPIPMISTGVFFIIAVILNLLHFNKQVYLEVLLDNTIHYSSYFVESVVSLKELSDIKKVWVNTYILKIKGTRYFVSAAKEDIDYLKELIRTSGQ